MAGLDGAPGGHGGGPDALTLDVDELPAL